MSTIDIRNTNGKDIIVIDGAQMIFKNFMGKPTKYVPNGGKIEFSVVIDDQAMAEELTNRGWNVKIKPPREEGDEPFCYLKVNVRFDNYPPYVVTHSGGRETVLNANTIGNLDSADIESCYMELTPYTYEPGKISAYLKTMHVALAESRFMDSDFARRYINNSEEIPFA